MKVNKSKIFEVYETKMGKRRSILLTKNLTPGKTVYDEKTFKDEGVEYREWNPQKSKLAASILKGTPNTGIRVGDVILYLGSSTGTTVSHVSDIVGREGFIFALDLAPRVMRELVFVCEARKNIAPVLADANNPMSYADKVCQADVLYQDVAQKNQVDIFLKNIDLFLKKGGYALLAVKARSIDVTKKPKQIFRQVKEQLEEEVTIIDYRELEPYQKDHCMFICKKK
ncbi:fibrillarin-like rRNA/tRNA 2'-O-methyltransferase [Candidatus Woesearchaeota archaeon]|nr:fibrillarin-like rRNA/tRNA 2'-O-methyltransferase [Candidatus Woesearchaeota archaeon]